MLSGSFSLLLSLWLFDWQRANWNITEEQLLTGKMLLAEIKGLNITDLLLWIIVQRLKLINVEHIVFEYRAASISVTHVGGKNSESLTLGDYHRYGFIHFGTWVYSEFFSCISFIFDTIWFDLQPDAFCKFRFLVHIHWYHII